ncbi:hypothetical protein BV22DRAFT_1123482 [Leucogyrophana mollusca]|uniref:Uncharacterized protein n=1 Tax=Leucogyrophana mollusca TaxID=85980 RepID=A0ACB8B1H6_9AGAM|nr:hypothetical protein BV22DRAFT_1123482 [Leucogyrophana mollusca]
MEWGMVTDRGVNAFILQVNWNKRSIEEWSRSSEKMEIITIRKHTEKVLQVGGPEMKTEDWRYNVKDVRIRQVHVSNPVPPVLSGELRTRSERRNLEDVETNCFQSRNGTFGFSFRISDKSEWSRRLRKNTETRGVLRKDSRENNRREKDLEAERMRSNRKPVQRNNKKDKGGMVPEGGVGPELGGAM